MDITSYLKDSKKMTSIFITSSKEKSDVLAPIALKLYNGESEKLLHDEDGRPIFESTGISISHSGDYWCCAFSDGPCGIDIERIRDLDYTRLSGRFFAESEKEMVTDKKSFFKVWTAKESYAKYTGKGLIKTLNVSPFEADVHVWSSEIAENYMLSICTAEAAMPVIRDFNVD